MKRALLGVLLAMAGCATAAGGGRADVLAAGDVEAGVALEGALFLVKRAPGRAVPVPSYALSAATRGGLGHGVDIGARGWASAVRGLWNAGALVDAKLQFLGASDESHHHWDASVSVGASAARLTLGGADTIALGLPVRTAFGWNTGDSQIFFGPTFAAEVLLSANAKPVTIGWSGAFVGLAWRVLPQLELRPELAVRYAPVKWNGLIASSDRMGLTQLELALAGTWLF